MFTDMMYDLFDNIMTKYLNYGYTEAGDSYFFKEIIQIFKNIWIIIDKGNNKYDSNRDHVYEKMAMITFFRIDCKKRICQCDGSYFDFCDTCIEFSDTLYMLKLKDDIETHEIINQMKKEQNIKFVNLLNKGFENFSIKDFRKNKTREKDIQLRLCSEINGRMEVETKSGFIDILSDTEIIEIKNGKNWKYAIGQILCYSNEYPEHTKRIHLFDIENNEQINKICKIYNIKVTYD